MAGCDTTNDTYEDYPDADVPDAAVQFDEPEVPRPRSGKATGTCRPARDSQCAPLTIRTSGSSDYYMVLRKASTNRKAATIYLRGGATFRGGMPLGSYELYYTAGEHWYGKKYFFGPTEPVTRADSTLDFSSSANGVSGMEITLYPVVGGNMTTSDGDFGDLS